jgi:hypothetical protein
LVNSEMGLLRELVQTWSFRGSKSRNKVSVGEPAEGSLLNIYNNILLVQLLFIGASWLKAVSFLQRPSPVFILVV